MLILLSNCVIDTNKFSTSSASIAPPLVYPLLDNPPVRFFLRFVRVLVTVFVILVPAPLNLFLTLSPEDPPTLRI